MPPIDEIELSCNELENPIGIETSGMSTDGNDVGIGCNELENPIGIETLRLPVKASGNPELQRT